ncbi:MAG: polysaccharide pyruvyl transferase family protein [Clostridiales bacterium]|nr:polysaccharide pyruvyl transferase family protein [Clostridiales bacterium]
MSVRVAYCTGFWCTNIGNAFFSLGVKYVLEQILGKERVTVVSDYQTYTTGYGRRMYPSKNQLEYLTKLDVDYLVLAGPVISKYFLPLWRDILVKLESRGIRYILLSAGMMKMTDEAMKDCCEFFQSHSPYILSSRDRKTFDAFGKYADYSYDGICFSFFAPDYYHPARISEKIITLNFDKISEPLIEIGEKEETGALLFEGKQIRVKQTGVLPKLAAKTDRFSDALIYASSILPKRRRPDKIADYMVIRTDHRFHPHFRRKIYEQPNSFCADIPYGYLNIYANSELTMSDRVHACAVTLAYGHSAMLFAKTDRNGLLKRVGAEGITKKPVQIDMDFLDKEKAEQISWLSEILKEPVKKSEEY